MTISTTTNRYSYSGNGVTTAFQYQSRFLEDEDLVVVLVSSTGVETTKTLTTHYTVSGAGVAGGGTVTMLTPPAVGETLVIYGDPVTSQPLDLVENDSLPAEDLETALDRLTLQIQRLRDRIGRAIRLSDGDPEVVSIVLPSVADRASKALTFDEDGNVSMQTDFPVTGLSISNDVEDMLSATDADGIVKSVIDNATARTSLDEEADYVMVYDASGTVGGKALLREIKAAMANRRNMVINGSFDVWQRGTSIAVSASSTAYTADRWCVFTNANQACTIARVSGLANSLYALKFQRNSGQTGTGTLILEQPFETIDIAKLRGRYVTISFRAKAGANFSPASSNIAVYLLAGTGTEGKRGTSAYTGETVLLNGQPVTLSTTDTAFSVVVPTLVPANATQMALQFYWSPTGTAGADDSLTIDDVQIEAGGVATPYAYRPIAEELALCERYYEKSYNQGVTPGASSGLGAWRAMDPVAAGSFSIHFKARKRSTPTIVTYSPDSGTAGKYRDVTSTLDFDTTVSSESETGFIVTLSTHGAADEIVQMQWTADAEL